MLNPRQMVFVGRNYVAHAKEMGNDVPKEPLLFLKPVSSIIRDGEAIVLHPVSTHIELEGEIGLVLGGRLSKANEAEALAVLSHIVAINDVSARDLQRNDGQWARAKGLDTFCPIGTPAPVPANLADITVVSTVNGVEKQRATASEMVFSIPALLAYISQFITLEAGDIVATGTPAGVTKLAPGDVVTIELFGSSGSLSRVSNPVVAGT
ncbi:MAG: fumarylacetoacetate hydrolase family protein [Gemmatimonadaceae bacterium]|jgi:2-keto-4-pentenoate hydratase/2-oxohepta-3-ene-1,7-dioic acid hydratase in catechol pathway|nr:fumarylacetoacetate hydrolase family protein [Gemmatimonadaceae bacterium]MCC6432680.1 fumarylacetoacetate hydrolase family protein [Gemmatimonadaceae bacterium]